MAAFAKLLRYSKFVQLGNFTGRIMVGRIAYRVADDLYIDFGCKFNAVCKRPEKNCERYFLNVRIL